MTHNDTTGPHAPAVGTTDDPRVLEVMKAYQAELESGSRPDRARYLARHPDLAGTVAECLDGLDLLYQGAKALTGTGTKRALRLETGLNPGDRLGEFEIVREVGRGGMGVVYEAVQPSLNRHVALKVLPAALAADKNRLRRFAAEAQAAAAVAHPHIVPVYAVGEDRGVNYYAMRLVDGSPLDSLAAGVALLRKHPPDEWPPDELPWSGDTVPPPGGLIDLARWDRRAYYRAVARIGVAVARALDHAHQNGVVHRDVKPANLLLGRDGHAWVTDFGLAQFTDGRAVTQTGAAVGTLRYMSPEQASGDRRRLDHRTDVYSLAATLYELLAARPAFPAEEPVTLLWQIAHDDPPAPRAIEPSIPADLETVLLKAMEKEPRDRYATAAEFADDLDRFLSGKPVLARRPGPWERAKRWAGRHPAAVAAALVSLVVVVLASGIATAVVAAGQRETRKAYDAADAMARAERDRADEAERRFQQAKQLGDLVFRISEEEIGADTPFQGPRRRLLLAALENYKKLHDAGHGDPAVRAELDRVLVRVQKLLAEQDAAREAEAAFLLDHEDVKADLGLSPEQRERIDPILARAREAMPRKGPPPGRPDFPERGGMGGPGPKGKGGKSPGGRGDDRGPPLFLTPPTRAELVQILTPPQRLRLRQIFLQVRGPMAFNEPEVVEALQLTADQRQQIRVLQIGPFGRPGGFFGGPPPKGPWGGPEEFARVTEQILNSLTPEQREKWRALTGKPFNPSSS